MREGWEYKKLGEVCEVLNGFAFKSEKYINQGVRIMRITNVQKGFVVDDDPKFYPAPEFEPNKMQQYLLKENDLLMSLTGNVGRVGLLPRDMLPAALNQRVACLRLLDDSCLLKFIFHLLNSEIFEQKCIQSAKGIAQKNMSTEWLKDYVIPIPPLSTQQQIVSELDLLSHILDQKRQQLKEYDALAESIFYDMFGDPVENPKGWEVYTLRNIVKMKAGKAIKASELSPNPDSGLYPCFGSNGIRGYIAKTSHSGIYPIIGRQGALCGCVNLAIGDFYATEHAIVATPLNENNPIWLFYLLTYLKLNKLAHGQAQPGIGVGDLDPLQVPLPPLSLQQSFAEKIESIEHQKQLLKESIKETETLFQSRMDYWFNT